MGREDTRWKWISLLMLAGAISLVVFGFITDNKSQEDDRRFSEVEPYCSDFNEAVEGANPTTEVLVVIDECLENLRPLDSTKYVLRYETLMQEEKAEFSNQIFKRGNHEVLYEFFPDSFEPERIDEVTDPEFRSTLRDLVHSGYTLTKSENGLYQVSIDYDFFKRFEGKIPRRVSEYFRIMKVDQTKPLLGNKGLLGTPEEVMERLELFDRYINQYPKSHRLETLSEKANALLLALVYGYENDDPYDDDDKIRSEYFEVYKELSKGEDTLMRKFLAGVVEALEGSDYIWNDDVYSYIINYPEIYRSRYLNASIYPDAFVDVGFGWTHDNYLYYYPVFYGMDNRAEQGKLNLMGRSIVEKRMLGSGFDGMYTGGNYIWSDFELTFNRRNWISIKYDIYTELPDGSYYWTIESLNYNLARKREIQLRDVLQVDEERELINETVKGFFEESRTYYAVSLEDFYKNPNPDFYLQNNGITLLIPVNQNTEATERNVEIFIPFEKFRTSVEYIYKIPSRSPDAERHD